MIFWGCKKTFLTLLIFSLVLGGCSRAKKNLDNPVEQMQTEGVIPTEKITVSPLENIIEEETFEEYLAIEDEEERIAKSLEELENASSQTLDEEIEEEKEAFELWGENSLLLFSEVDSEVIQPGFEDGFRTLTYSIAGRVKKNFYDDQYRLFKSDFWEISTLENSKIVKMETFEYKGNEKNPFLKAVRTESKLEKIFYAKKNVVEKTETYKIVKDKPYITKLCLFTYDSEGREIEIKTRDFSYNDEEDTKRRSVFEKLLKYKYNSPDENGNEIPRNVNYYENGELKSYENYTSVYGTYTMGYYFDKKYSVVTVYQNNQKVKEIIYLDGNPIRVHKNEKNEVSVEH